MNGFRLGSVLGFKIRLDFSWFVIFFLVLWSFTMAVFPAQMPGLGTAVYFIMGLSGALLFFASLVAHELSHSVVARLKGIPVEGITLFIFGGMAHTKMEAERPGDEFAIAGVGPLMSVVIAIVLGALAWLFATQGWSDPTAIVLQYVAFLNVLLAVFNLLPGFPLDGGRLFRAVVWKVTGDLTRATRVASAGGRWLGYLLVGIGLWLAFRGDVVGGLWLVFIGWFLRNAAAASYRQHLIRDVLDDVSARQTMTPVPVTVPADLPLAELMEDYFMRRRYISYPVEDGGAPIGIVTLNQAKEVPREEWGTRTVRDTMAPIDDALAVTPDTPMTTVLDKLRASPVQRLLVVQNGTLEGLITARDVAAWLEKMRSMER